MALFSHIKKWIYQGPLPLVGKLFYKKNKYINVIYYHDIVEGAGKGVAQTNVRDFFRQIEFLKGQGYKTFTFDDLERDSTLCLNDSSSVLITFDDGWRSNYTKIFDFMCEREICYNIFLAAGLIDRQEDHLTWEMVREMYKSGRVGFGAHTFNHIDVGRIGSIDKDAEFVSADKMIYEKSGIICHDFCYPFGSYSVKSNKYLAEEHGYRRIYTSDRMFSYPLGNSTIFGRNAIESGDSIRMFHNKVSGYYNFMSSYKKSKNIVK